MITGEQVKAARALRALLGWDTTTLASKAGVADSVVREIEADSVVPYEARLLILRALRLSGVEFLDGEPPRFKTTRATWGPPPI